MTSGLVFLGISLVLSILFFVWVIRAIVCKVYKKPFGKGNVVATILFPIFSGVTFFIGFGILTFWLATGGLSEFTEKVSYVAAVNVESAKKGWTKGLLKKMGNLSFSIEKVYEIDSDYEKTFNEFKSDKYKTFEAYLIVENKSAVPEIRYKELRKANIAYAYDENDVFIPCFIINHSDIDEIPWLIKWLLPNYRLDSVQEFIPSGKSYLNVRFDIPEGHNIKKICIADSSLEIDSSKIELKEVNVLKTESDKKE